MPSLRLFDLAAALFAESCIFGMSITMSFLSLPQLPFIATSPRVVKVSLLSLRLLLRLVVHGVLFLLVLFLQLLL